MSLWKDKYVIGLTGNIAVGKSLVRQMLQHLGAYPVDADGLTHQVLMPGAPAYLPVVEMFGKLVLDENGHINRQMLGAIVFAIPEALARLEGITHPAINQAIMTLVSRAKQPIIVIEAIKLLESPSLSQAVDAVWVVDAPPEAQMKRLMEKRKMSADEARRRITVQGSQADKLAKANVIVRNDGNAEETWKQVQNAWNDLQKALNIRSTESDGMVSVTAVAAPPAPPKSTPGLPGAGAAVVNPVPPRPVPPAPAPVSQPSPTMQPIQTVAPSSPPTNPIKPVQVGVTPVAPPATAPVAVTVRRGKPGETDGIAKFITRVSGQTVDRMDIMLAFGQKSYLLATDPAASIVGVVGWQVENLITRVDEVYLDSAVPKESVIAALITAIEDHSKDLQSEVAFIALGTTTTPNEVYAAFVKGGYHPIKMDDIKFPAWREAARELLNPEMRPLMKQLRTDRVMKPI
ncbi:MAG: dephospho-CoA kinase [bacterium]|nr:dephospho-CoA kinase [bacterium]